MKSLKTGLLFVVVLCVAGSAAYLGYLQGIEKGRSARQGADANASGADESKEKPVAKVKVATVVEANIRKVVSAYGTIVAVPEVTEIFSVPFEARVVRVFAKLGQKLEGGSDLIEVTPSPDALQSLEEARTTHEGAVKDLANAQSRFDMKLATAQELQTAQQALLLAKGKLDAMEKKKIQLTRLQVPDDGIVSKIDAQEGQTVPANGPLLEVIDCDRIEVRLGVEPGQESQMQADQPVRVQPVHDGAEPIDGKVRLVTSKVNTATRLVDVFVSLPEDTPLLLDEYVKGEVEVATKMTLVVPRSAVLPDEDKQVLYTVKDGNKAVRHEVKIGWEEDDRVEILPADEGDKASDEGVSRGEGVPPSRPEGILPSVASYSSSSSPSSPSSSSVKKMKKEEGKEETRGQDALATRSASATSKPAAAPPVQAGDLVVIKGNYELEDGMEVEIEAAEGEHKAGGEHEDH